MKLVLLLLVISIVRGRVIDRRLKDANDYEEFLFSTIDGEYQDPITPELEDLQNYWERSGKFEGDIVLTEEQIDSLLGNIPEGRNAVINTTLHWPNGIVYYKIDENIFDESQTDAILNGMAEIESVSCLEFRERTSEDNFINVTWHKSGCFSSVGMVGSSQIINLTPNVPGSGCFRPGTVVHEFLHAIGFYHEQSTFNRDDWVKILWDNIQADMAHNFKKYSSKVVTNFDVEYDYGSVMHYSEYGFSKDGNKTIIPIKATNETIGQRVGMSPGDIKKLNLLYNCNTDSDQKKEN